MLSVGSIASIGGFFGTLKNSNTTKENNTQNIPNSLKETLSDGTKKICTISLNPNGSTIEKGKLVKPNGIIEEYIEHKNKDEVPTYDEAIVTHSDGKIYQRKVTLVPDRSSETYKKEISADDKKVNI